MLEDEYPHGANVAPTKQLPMETLKETIFHKKCMHYST